MKRGESTVPRRRSQRVEVRVAARVRLPAPVRVRPRMLGRAPPYSRPHWHNGLVVESSLGPLLPLFDRERAAGNALAVGVLVHTAGSTYRKPGALMLIAANGEYAGLLSGGCLEGDLREYARSVIETGEPRIVSYDMRGPEDLLWGLGLGCEGAMQILLLRVGPDRDWEPLTHLTRALAAYSPTAVGIVTESATPDVPPGTVLLPYRRNPGDGGTDGIAGLATLPGDLAPSGRALLTENRVRQALADATRNGGVSWIEGEAPGPGEAPISPQSSTAIWKLFILPLALPPRILVLGAGPDAAPVLRFAAQLDWKITIADHRAAYAEPAHFPDAERVVHARPDELSGALDLSRFSAAVVMSHHLPSDLAYLRLLANTEIPYIGLLGPAVRREKLLTDLGPDAQKLRPRLRAPVGLPLGGRTPESIALSIVAEIHAFVHGAAGLQPDSRPL